MYLFISQIGLAELIQEGLATNGTNKHELIKSDLKLHELNFKNHKQNFQNSESNNYYFLLSIRVSFVPFVAYLSLIKTMDEKIIFKDLSFKIVGLAMQVHRELGHGFLEKVYENALMVLFDEYKIEAKQQFPVKVNFHGRVVGDYVADILVENQIILELKAQDKLSEVHKAQTLNYLRATNLKLAILLNFGKTRLEHERLVF